MGLLHVLTQRTPDFVACQQQRLRQANFDFPTCQQTLPALLGILHRGSSAPTRKSGQRQILNLYVGPKLI